MTRLFWMGCALFCRAAGSLATQRKTWWLIRMFGCEEHANKGGFDWVLLAMLFLVLLWVAYIGTLLTELREVRFKCTLTKPPKWRWICSTSTTKTYLSRSRR